MENIENITEYKFNDTIGTYYELLKLVKREWKAKDVFYWVLEFILTSLSKLAKTKVGEKIATSYIDNIVRHERYGYGTAEYNNSSMMDDDEIDRKNTDETADDDDDGIDLSYIPDDNMIISD